jgi:hypothetical protein
MNNKVITPENKEAAKKALQKVYNEATKNEDYNLLDQVLILTSELGIEILM